MTPEAPTSRIERAFDIPMWIWCWVAFWLVLLLPSHRVERLWFWLLPFAGYYAYHDPTWMDWRWSERNRR